MALLLAFIASLFFLLSSGQDLKATDVDRRGAPWWDALRNEAFYRQCQSSCTESSKGVRTQIQLCDDREVCRGFKQPLDEFASEKCELWRTTSAVPVIKFLGEGRRFKHEPAKGNWISCAIFCKTDHRQWYSPRRELGREGFFPDGIWCHNDGKDNYYCQKNLCLPEGYEVTEAVRSAQLAMDSDLQNLIIDEEILTL